MRVDDYELLAENDDWNEHFIPQMSTAEAVADIFTVALCFFALFWIVYRLVG
jgi:hypothetical protein